MYVGPERRDRAIDGEDVERERQRGPRCFWMPSGWIRLEGSAFVRHNPPSREEAGENRMGGWRCDEPREGECVWNYCDEGGYWEPTPIEPELEPIVGCIY